MKLSLSLPDICLLGACLMICALLVTPALGASRKPLRAAPVQVELFYIGATLRGLARMLERKQVHRCIQCGSAICSAHRI